jgi:hypothetical protein
MARTTITAMTRPMIHFGFPAGAGAGGGDAGASASGGGGGGGGAVAGEGAAAGASAGAPHCSQNFPAAGSGPPHFGQTRDTGIGCPQLSQNWTPSAAGAPQAGHTRVDETSTMKSLCTRLLPESIYTIPNVPRRRSLVCPNGGDRTGLEGVKDPGNLMGSGQGGTTIGTGDPL